ncbi:MAG: hypothetical protein C0397_03270 [Odoribacter sp.]|nr:hypothetical protein [Odoribacter sp.]
MFDIEYLSDRNLPFELKENQILYVANKKIELYEEFFSDVKSVQMLLNRETPSYQFLSIHDLLQQAIKKIPSFREFAYYTLPFLKSDGEISELIMNINIVDFSNLFFSTLNYYEDFVPGLVFRKNDNTLIYLKISCANKSEIEQILSNIELIYEDKGGKWISFDKGSIVCEPQLAYIKYFSEPKDTKITEAVLNKINQIDKPEIFRYLIKVLSKKLEQTEILTNRLSRLRIDHDGGIFLTDFNQSEIILTPLYKAVFFLFLKHPEGILFSELPKYRAELTNIYKELNSCGNLDSMIKSLEDITDPNSNSINEKCSRIKSALISMMGDPFAQHYYITGARGEPKKIILDRNLVQWDRKF